MASSGTMQDRIRKRALSLPETDEASPFGDPWFRVLGKMFCCLSTHATDNVVAVKIGKENLDLFLRDERFFQAPYIGRHGWVCLRLNSKTPWPEVESLIVSSYNLIAPRRLRILSKE